MCMFSLLIACQFTHLIYITSIVSYFLFLLIIVNANSTKLKNSKSKTKPKPKLDIKNNLRKKKSKLFY